MRGEMRFNAPGAAHLHQVCFPECMLVGAAAPSPRWIA
jgi:hypothetical protein